MFNLASASPEMVRAMVDSDSGGAQESQEHLSVLAHDVWAVGCLLIELIAGHSFFEAQGVALTVQQRTADVCQQHQRWVCLLPLVALSQGGCMAWQPDEPRHQTSQSWLRELGHVWLFLTANAFSSKQCQRCNELGACAAGKKPVMR